MGLSGWVEYLSGLDLFGGTPPSSPNAPTTDPSTSSASTSTDTSTSSRRTRGAPPTPPASTGRRRNSHRYRAPSLFNYLFRPSRHAAYVEAHDRRERRLRMQDKYFGFVPLSRRRSDLDIEACRILGAALTEGRVMMDGDLPRVWREPTKAELRGIGRLGEVEGGRRCCGLVSAPRMGKKRGVVVWRALERAFRVSEEMRVALEGATRGASFTKVPAKLLAGVEMKRRLNKRLACKGNSEQDGQMEVGIMGVVRKSWGPVMACMPGIEEERADNEKAAEGEVAAGKVADGEAAEGDGEGATAKGVSG